MLDQKRKPRRRFGAALLAAALLSAGSHSTGAANAADLKPISVAVGGRSIITYLPVSIADQLGYFRQEGLQVTFDDFAGGSKSVEAVVGGSADLMIGAYQYTMTLQQKGVALTDIILLSQSPGVVVALTKANAAKYKSPRDLKGMKIGVTAPGSNAEMAVDLLLASDGLSRKDVSIIGVGSGTGAVAAVKAGELDGMANFDPIMSNLIGAGDLVPIVDGRTLEGANKLYNGPFVTASVLATPTFLAAHPDEAKAFTRAVVRALHYMHTASLDDIMKAVPPAFYGRNEADYRVALKGSLALVSPTGEMPLASAQNTYKVLQSFGQVKAAPPVDLQKTIDNSYVKAAQQSAL